MKKNLLCVAAMVATLASVGVARAADTLIYSFESPAVNPDGFGPNGGGVTISQDTVGATDGTNSLKMSVLGGATFVGALTGNVPGILNNPPGVGHATADITIGPNDAFTGAFDVIGITIFGASQPSFPGGQQFGLQAQFSSLFHVEGKLPGTYKNVEFPLVGATNPLTFDSGLSFNQIFGSGPNQLIPTGFEFFLNKSNDAPSTVYFDNVRIGGNVPEPATCTLLGLGAIGLGAFVRRRVR